jgi:hypothetical protein
VKLSFFNRVGRLLLTGTAISRFAAAGARNPHRISSGEKGVCKKAVGDRQRIAQDASPQWRSLLRGDRQIAPSL